MKVKKNLLETENKLEEKTQTPVLTWQQVLLKATGLSLFFVFILLLLTAVAVGIFAYSKFSTFLSETNLEFSEFKQIVETGVNQKPPTINNKTSVLILGLDKVSNKQDAPPLTDTIILLTIDYATGSIQMVSLPRDLWSEGYKTKINALYYYGKERYPTEPERFSREVIKDMTGVDVNYTVVFSLDSIAELVKIFGGLEVDVPVGFIDSEFPREDVDVTATKDPALLYETVEFKPGIEKMSPERVTKYIRSRHSEGDTGTDINRSSRQQLIISSLITKMKSREVLTNPKLIASLYRWYGTYLASSISVPDAISILRALYPVRNSIILTTNSISISPTVPNGTLEHLPPEKTDNQWTYSIVDTDAFKTEMYDKLFRN